MTKTSLPGAKVAKRINERLPRAATAKTADKASVPVKRRTKAAKDLSQYAGAVAPIAAKTDTESVLTKNVKTPEAKPAVKRIPRTKKVADPLAVSAKPAVDPLAVKTDVPDPLAKVSTPSTAKLVTRRRKPATAADVRATPAKKVPAPKVGAVKSAVKVPAAKTAPSLDQLKDSAQLNMQTFGRIKRVKKDNAVSNTTPTASGLSPKAVEAIEQAKKAMDAEPPKPAAKKPSASALKGKEVVPVVKRNKPAAVSGLLTPEQRKNRAELFEAAQALQARATQLGFVVRITDESSMPLVNGQPMKIEHVFSVLTKESHDRIKAELSTGKVLLDRFDALYKEIIAAGGKVVGDLTLDGVIFKYNPDAPAATTRTSRNKPRPATKTVLKQELLHAATALQDKAKNYGFWVEIVRTEGAGDVVSVTPLKK